ncbi:MAG: hypothetical protein WCO54_00425 [Bacteroidota bacterium]
MKYLIITSLLILVSCSEQRYGFRKKIPVSNKESAIQKTLKINPKAVIVSDLLEEEYNIDTTKLSLNKVIEIKSICKKNALEIKKKERVYFKNYSTNKRSYSIVSPKKEFVFSGVFFGLYMIFALMSQMSSVFLLLALISGSFFLLFLLLGIIKSIIKHFQKFSKPKIHNKNYARIVAWIGLGFVLLAIPIFIVFLIALIMKSDSIYGILAIDFASFITGICLLLVALIMKLSFYNYRSI